MAMRHDAAMTAALRPQGYNIPSPVLYQYDWARHPPLEAQKTAVDTMVGWRRAYNLLDMGCGKTRTVIYAYDFLRQQGIAQKMLVVAPLSTLQDTWAEQVFEITPWYRISIVHGSKKQRLEALQAEADIYVINHDGLKVLSAPLSPNKRTRVMNEALRVRDDINILCIDELATYRKAQSDRWRAAHALIQSKDWAYIWGLTGSPMPKEPTDVWAQCRLLTPDTVPRFFTQFKNMVMRQVGQWSWLPVDDAKDIAYAAMQPAVRFARHEVTDLPPTTRVHRTVEMSPAQKKAYKELFKDFVYTHPEGTVTAANAAVQTTKLLQCACGFVYDEHRQPIDLDPSPKLNELVEIIEQTEHKVLVFVPFVEALSFVAKHLEKNGFSCALVYGKTSTKDRNEIFASFKREKDPRVIVAHPKTMAHGLNFQVADTVVWFTVTSDNEIYEQACDRVARIGQDKNTHIIHLVSSKVEQRAVKTLERRGSVQKEFLAIYQNNRQELAL